jgi:hypothetical protein
MLLSFLPILTSFIIISFQLAESWTEGEMFRPLELRGNDPSLAPFTTIVKTNAGGTFERDADFFKTVHSGGVGRAREEAEDKAREKQEWRDKVRTRRERRRSGGTRYRSICTQWATVRRELGETGFYLIAM